MAKEKFFIPVSLHYKIQLKEVEGDRITISKLPCFIFSEIVEGMACWNISHLETGFNIVNDFAKKDAIRFAKKKLSEQTDDRFLVHARQECEKLKIKLPVNK